MAIIPNQPINEINSFYRKENICFRTNKMERSDGLVQRRRQPKQEEEDVDRNEQVCRAPSFSCTEVFRYPTVLY